MILILRRKSRILHWSDQLTLTLISDKKHQVGQDGTIFGIQTLVKGIGVVYDCVCYCSVRC